MRKTSDLGFPTGPSSRPMALVSSDQTYNADQLPTGVNAYQSTSTSDLVYSAAYGYDADSHLTDLNYTTETDGGGTLLAGYHWDYGDSGLVNDEFSYKDTSDTADRTSSYSTWAETNYGYDSDQELTSTSYSNFANAPLSNTGQSFDQNGNRTTATNNSGVTGSAASSTNRMLFDGAYYYAYDADGNRIARWVDNSGIAEGSPQPGDTNITIYKWNEKGELTGVTTYSTFAEYADSSDGSETTFAYNAFQQMVSTTPPGESPTTEYFIYDGENVALVLNSSGAVIERELTAAAVDQYFASENGSTHVVNWLLTDNQGTVRDVAQYSDGTSIVDHVIYDSFGQVSSQSSDDAADQSSFGYQGMWQDAAGATGLDYDKFRWYDAVDAVLASQDPLGFGGGQTNTEAFVGNSPTNFTDPLGLEADGLSGSAASGANDGGGESVGLMSTSGGSGGSGGCSIPVWGGGGGSGGGVPVGGGPNPGPKNPPTIPLANGRNILAQAGVQPVVLPPIVLPPIFGGPAFGGPIFGPTFGVFSNGTGLPFGFGAYITNLLAFANLGPGVFGFGAFGGGFGGGFGGAGTFGPALGVFNGTGLARGFGAYITNLLAFANFGPSVYGFGAFGGGFGGGFGGAGPFGPALGAIPLK